jgi:hypothetical protein
MKNTKKRNVTPEFVVVYRVEDGGDRGMGDGSYDVTRLVTREQLDLLIAELGTKWLKKVYKLGNEVKFLAPEYVED